MRHIFLKFDAKCLAPRLSARTLRVCIAQWQTWMIAVDVMAILGCDDVFDDRHKRRLSELVQLDDQEIMVNEDGLLMFMLGHATPQIAEFAGWYRATVMPAAGARMCALLQLPYNPENVLLPYAKERRVYVAILSLRNSKSFKLQVRALEGRSLKNYKTHHYVRCRKAPECVRRIYTIAGSKYANGKYRSEICMELNELIGLVEDICLLE